MRPPHALAVPPPVSFHCVEVGADGMVSQLQAASQLPMRVNGGSLAPTPRSSTIRRRAETWSRIAGTSLARKAGCWRIRILAVGGADRVGRPMAQWRGPLGALESPGQSLGHEPLGADLKPAVWSDVA